MNQTSSRSHSLLLLTVRQKRLDTFITKRSVLTLVDLAGSEKVGKSHASGIRFDEAKKINLSLTTLGMCIHALTDSASTHVPFRDSKLTRILQESLGGNSRTSLLVACSPSSWNREETINTLRFGIRAKKMVTKPRVNAELSPAEMRKLIRAKEKDVQTLTEQLKLVKAQASTLGQHLERVTIDLEQSTIRLQRHESRFNSLGAIHGIAVLELDPNYQTSPAFNDLE